MCPIIMSDHSYIDISIIPFYLIEKLDSVSCQRSNVGKGSHFGNTSEKFWENMDRNEVYSNPSGIQISLVIQSVFQGFLKVQQGLQFESNRLRKLTWKRYFPIWFDHLIKAQPNKAECQITQPGYQFGRNLWKIIARDVI